MPHTLLSPLEERRVTVDVGEEPLASNLRAKDDEEIRLWPRNEIHVVVTGGETNGYWRIYGARRGTAVCIDDWR